MLSLVLSSYMAVGSILISSGRLCGDRMPSFWVVWKWPLLSRASIPDWVVLQHLRWAMLSCTGIRQFQTTMNALFVYWVFTFSLASIDPISRPFALKFFLLVLLDFIFVFFRKNVKNFLFVLYDWLFNHEPHPEEYILGRSLGNYPFLYHVTITRFNSGLICRNL